MNYFVIPTICYNMSNLTRYVLLHEFGTIYIPTPIPIKDRYNNYYYYS